MAYLCEVLFTVFAGEMYQWITHNVKSGANSNTPLWGSVLKWTLTWQARGSGGIFGRSLCIKIFCERITFRIKPGDLKCEWDSNGQLPRQNKYNCNIILLLL